MKIGSIRNDVSCKLNTLIKKKNEEVLEYIMEKISI